MRECERRHRAIPCLYRDMQLIYGFAKQICLQPYCIYGEADQRTGEEILSTFVSSLNDEEKAILSDYLEEKYEKAKSWKLVEVEGGKYQHVFASNDEDNPIIIEEGDFEKG